MALIVWTSGLVCIIFLLHSVGGLRLAAFNLKIFGKSKASKPDVLETIAKVIARYDIILLMEVRDITGDANRMLHDKIQQNKELTSKYQFEISDRLGRTKSKEEYIFVYRVDRGISVVDRYHYDDGDETTGNDTFEREPFVVRFRSSKTVVSEFSLVAVHTNPTKARAEVTSLIDVYEDVRRKWNSDDVIILGDLNADCNYIRKSHWPDIEIRTDTQFYWPIGDDVDTTITDTDCAYDRFIIAGSSLKSSLVNNSVGVYDFQMDYGLTKQQALDVSDHFPIELELAERPAVGEGASTTFNMGVAIVSTLFVIKLCRC